jgi:hypothetical protein
MQFGGIPFEQFMGGGMGGMPGMGGHPGMQRQSKPVDTSRDLRKATMRMRKVQLLVTCVIRPLL